jgi:hypothetical protein
LNQDERQDSWENDDVGHCRQDSKVSKINN